jgi:hypothetical protein
MRVSSSWRNTPAVVLDLYTFDRGTPPKQFSGLLDGHLSLLKDGEEPVNG